VLQLAGLNSYLCNNFILNTGLRCRTGWRRLRGDLLRRAHLPVLLVRHHRPGQHHKVAPPATPAVPTVRPARGVSTRISGRGARLVHLGQLRVLALLPLAVALCGQAGAGERAAAAPQRYAAVRAAPAACRLRGGPHRQGGALLPFRRLLQRRRGGVRRMCGRSRHGTAQEVSVERDVMDLTRTDVPMCCVPGWAPARCLCLPAARWMPGCR
jgi:hypothetical protein